MADSETSQEDRVLAPSQRRLDQAREEGQVARSRDLTHFLAVGAGCGMLVFGGPLALQTCVGIMKTGLRFDHLASTQSASLAQRLSDATMDAALLVLPVGFVLMLVACGAAVALGGWVFSTKALMPKFSRMNPLSFPGRIFSRHAVLENVKLALLAVVLGFASYLYLASKMNDFVGSIGLALPAALSHVGGLIIGGLFVLVLVLAGIAAADVPLQMWRHHTQLKMTLEEAKQENKEMEGDPHVKGRIRSMQRETAKRRMMANVPGASVVVTNPTHYAVALAYDDTKSGAPRVVAMGTDLVAAKIREIAAANDVPLLEAPPLARALYAHAELDREIPVALYTAVAQVLAYVFQLRAAMAGRAPAPRALPAIEVPADLDPKNAAPAPAGA